ncbi:MAG: YgiT-type zinc finger protein [Flavobacteriales bacterium]|nr:YgiT-type zinc finger protein [Flavobacteriales bacterium]
MICSTCQIGTCKEGTTEELFNKNGRLIILKDLPAMVCNNCGAKFYSEQTSQIILDNLKKAENSNAELEVISAKVA